MPQSRGIAGWETVWQLTDFLSLIALEELGEGGPRLENGVSVTRATYWGKSNLERNLLCYLPQTRAET